MLKKKLKYSPQGIKDRNVILDEDIVILEWDMSPLKEEHMIILSELFARKAKQFELIMEHQKKQVLFEIKYIILDAIFINDLDDQEHIIVQLVHILDQINESDIDVQQKLMERAKKRYDNEVMDKVSLEISINMVEISKKDTNSDKTTLDINSLFRFIFDVPSFIKEVRE